MVWPAALEPQTNRLGYTASAGIYLPAQVAAGGTVTLVSGMASAFAGLPNAASHRLLGALGAGQSLTFSGLAAGEVVSLQGTQGQFVYTLDIVAPTPTNTPVPPTPTATPVPAEITLGETTVLAVDDFGNSNLVLAQRVDLSENATIGDVSVYVAHAVGQMRLGVYADAGGNPGALRAQTAAFTPTVGWNTQPVQTPVELSAGVYWLAYLAQSNELLLKAGAGGEARGFSQPFGPLPESFGTLPLSAAVHWSLYATLQSGGSVAAAAAVDAGIPWAADTGQADLHDAATEHEHIYLPLVVR